MTRFDWPELMRLGLSQLHLKPSEFWALTPVELRLMLGLEDRQKPMNRKRLEALVAAHPDRGKESGHAGSGEC